MRTIGIQISSRAFGRVVGSAAPGCAAALPRAWIFAGSPGAIRDSSTSRRSTANRTGAFGSAGRNVGEAAGTAPAAFEPCGLGDAGVDGAAVALGAGVAVASGSAIGVTV